jgi:hypothetical protein
MPLYTAISQEGTISTETKAKIEEITRIHTSVMKVPKNQDNVDPGISKHPPGVSLTSRSSTHRKALIRYRCYRRGHRFSTTTREEHNFDPGKP